MHINYESEFPNLPDEHYCWLLEYLETKIPGEIMDVSIANPFINNVPIPAAFKDTTPEFEHTFRKNFSKLLVKI